MDALHRVKPTFVALVAVVAVVGVWDPPARGEECERQFDSTYALIQAAIFEGRGCTSSFCHVGANPAGGLDLSVGVSYGNLIDQAPQSVPPDTIRGLKRVEPGEKDSSLLWLNLAAAALPEEWEAPLRAMPLGLPPLTLREIEAVRLWIEQGAPREGVVPGTDRLLDACLPEPKPLLTAPLPPPEPGTGVQVRMPRWTIPPHSENEVCFVSYFDVTDQVPEPFLGEDRTTFRHHLTRLRQHPSSHHLIVSLYNGSAPPDHPAWGPFTCKGGEKDGEPCVVTDLGACGQDGLCGSEPITAFACIGYGPGDAFILTTPFTGAQESSSAFSLPPGVYTEAPLKGLVIFNSHAFNLSDEPAPVEAWANFEFAAPEEQLFVGQGGPTIDSIFKMNVEPFRAQEVCDHETLPPGAEVYELSSHMHKRGKRFRTFLGQFACSGGPNHGDACSPFGPDFETPDLCAGAPCLSQMPPAAGDCNGDLDISVDELVLGVNIALGMRPLGDCTRFDSDNSRSVVISELVTAVRSALEPTFRDPGESLLYVNLVYGDPLVLRLKPPIVFPGDGSHPEARTFTFCALYDNGFSDPNTVKRRSTSPATPDGVPFGGPCEVPTGCTEGRIGGTCSGDTQAERDESCDSPAGQGEGRCDACLLTGGATTEDEMMQLFVFYYVRDL